MSEDKYILVIMSIKQVQTSLGGHMTGSNERGWVQMSVDGANEYGWVQTSVDGCGQA